jgi:hypothetical protein
MRASVSGPIPSSEKTTWEILGLMSQGLRMFKTENVVLGSALPGVQKGDEVAPIAGLRMPFILRPLTGP